jgi:phytoene dehydrogenase-like protein
MPEVVIVGAGLAGLTCAKVLFEQGIRDLVVLEKADAPGGRVRTDPVEGYRLDRGFQVLFTAYPSVRRHLDLQALQVRSYRPGAVLVQKEHHYLLGDPLRDLSSLGATLTNPLLPWTDKLRIMQLRLQLQGQSLEQIQNSRDQTTATFLHHYGFSNRTRQSFFNPFYRGILLDPSLETSARLFQFYFKMLAQGEIVTPRFGMGQISLQLAQAIPAQLIRYQSPVVRVQLRPDQDLEVYLQTGERILAPWVVCAVEAPAVRQLLQLEVPDQPRSVTCLYWAAPFSLTRGAYLYLNATGEGRINHWMELTQVSPDLAPVGQHLYVAVILGLPDVSETALVQQCRRELQTWFPQADLAQLRYLRQYRIPFAQFAQPPGIDQIMQRIQSPHPRLLLAGEYRQQSSIEGAMGSGEQAALQILSC